MKKTDNRETPQAFFDELDREFHFDIDVCASKENTKIPDCYITEKEDAFSVSWNDFINVMQTPMWWLSHPVHYPKAWMNPPYSNITPWIAKAEQERHHGVTTVMLLPASVSTKWFHKYIWCSVTHTPHLEMDPK